jgi:hypothetical protein
MFLGSWICLFQTCSSIILVAKLPKKQNNLQILLTGYEEHFTQSQNRLKWQITKYDSLKFSLKVRVKNSKCSSILLLRQMLLRIPRCHLFPCLQLSFCNIFVVYPLCCETKGMSKKAMYFGVFYRYNREFTIYDAAGSPTRFQNKEICNARQKLRIIRGPRGIVNGVVILNTTLNKHYHVSTRQEVLYLKSKLQQTLHRFSRRI